MTESAYKRGTLRKTERQRERDRQTDIDRDRNRQRERETERDSARLVLASISHELLKIERK